MTFVNSKAHYLILLVVIAAGIIGYIEVTTQATVNVGEVDATFSVTTLAGMVGDLGLIEAESGMLVGNLVAISDPFASVEQAVTGFSTPQDGVRFTAAPQSVAIDLRYRSSTDSQITLTLNDQAESVTVLAPATIGNDYALATIALDTGEGDDLLVTSANASPTSDLHIDGIEYISSPFLQVSTLADSGVIQGDGISVSSNGEVFISGGPIGRVVRVDVNGQVSDFATDLVGANGSDFDSLGNLFVADYKGNAIRRITPEGEVSTFTDGLDGPAGVFVDEENNVFVSLFGANFSGNGATVLRITPAGEVSTFATGDGLRDVIGVTGDSDGNIYTGNWGSGDVFNITGGVVSPLANAGVRVNMITSSRGYIYVANGSRIKRIRAADGQVETLVGSDAANEIDGALATAEFVDPVASAFSESENALYVYDVTTGSIRVITFNRAPLTVVE